MVSNNIPTTLVGVYYTSNIGFICRLSMKLANRFQEEDKTRLALHKPYCWKCGSNQGCAFHHIFGTSESSILTAILLCHKCHKWADSFNVSNKEVQSELLQIAIREIVASEIELNKKDIHFYKSNITLYNINNERKTNN
jgi:hypothetical protein